jgi:hypothetical protein
LLLAIGIFGLSFVMFPTKIDNTQVYESNKHHHQAPPKAMIDEMEQAKAKVLADQARNRMLKQSSQWVAGEKKLKNMLKELVKLQADGKELGVPVLTRYLGPGIPAWPKNGMSVDEWKKLVDAKYAEMRKEEEEWRVTMGEIIEKERRG